MEKANWGKPALNPAENDSCKLYWQKAFQKGEE
jgi:hypothetical protein